MAKAGREIIDKLKKYCVELDEADLEILYYVFHNELTMVSFERLINTLKSCKYVVENNINGDFVECGVWRGGNGILAKKIFEWMGADKKIWMFDTFEGMTEPTDVDVNSRSKVSAKIKYDQTVTDTHSEWCYASLEDVKQNCKSADVRFDDFVFVKGDVCQTLATHDNLPEQISVLRLDTDWYESTKIELEMLYPRLNPGGVLILDDYGYWEGTRLAVDEYFAASDYKPLFNMVDTAGRVAIKR